MSGLVINSMTLPRKCSYVDNDSDCHLSPSYIVSIESGDNEYMIAVVCEDHKDQMEARLKGLRNNNLVPQGKLEFQEIRVVVTNCVRGTADE